MSEQHIVNRVSPSTYQQIEEAKLGASADGALAELDNRKKGPDPVPVPLPVPASLYPSDQVYKIAHVDEAIEPDELPEAPGDNIGNVVDVPVTSENVALGYLSVVQQAQEFIKFRKQTIAALKHLGVDTRRFFEV